MFFAGAARGAGDGGGVVPGASVASDGVVPVWCRCGAAVVPLWCRCGAAVVPLWCRCGAVVVPGVTILVCVMLVGVFAASVGVQEFRHMLRPLI